MNKQQLRKLLEEVRAGSTDVDEAARRLAGLPYEDLAFARVDHHRDIRIGFPEVILGQGKSLQQITAIAERILAGGSNLIVSRTGEEVYRSIRNLAAEAQFHPEARMVTVRRDRTDRGEGSIAVISAGTSDIPVAEEAAVTAEVMGNRVVRIYDAGVAGIHRLF